MGAGETCEQKLTLAKTRDKTRGDSHRNFAAKTREKIREKFVTISAKKIRAKTLQQPPRNIVTNAVTKSGTNSAQKKPCAPKRAVRSYVLREGRLTRAQQRALRELWPVYGIDLPENSADLQNHAQTFRQLFPRAAPVHLEIGFGDGEALLELAVQNPNCNFLGAEVHRPGLGRLLRELHARDINNIRVFRDDAAQVLTRAIPDSSLHAIYMFFPDPWPKKRHHKRRLLQPDFVERIAAKLTRGGTLYFATDWKPYAEHALQCLQESAALQNRAGRGNFAPRPPARPQTKFERRGVKLGHAVWDLVMEKVE